MSSDQAWAFQKVERKEAKIAPAAVRAAQAAFARALTAGGSVDIVRDGKIMRMLPSGKTLILGRVAPRVRKEKTVYRLVWTPPSRD